MASAGAAGRWRILFWVAWSLADNQGLLPRKRENTAGGEAAGSLTTESGDMHWEDVLS